MFHNTPFEEEIKAFFVIKRWFPCRVLRLHPSDAYISVYEIVTAERRKLKGHKEDTVSAWLRDAAEHTEAIEDIIFSECHVSRGQIDGLWSYVGNR